MEEILNKAKESLKNFGEDKEINDKNVLANYLDIITQNIKDNLKVINRNSYLLVISALLFYLIMNDFINLAENSFLGFSINTKDNTIILCFIMVLFSFLYFKNVSLWYQISNLKSRHSKLARNLFELGFNTDSLHLLLPFSLVENATFYLYNNENIKGIKKLPVILSFLAFMLVPPALLVYALVYLIRYSYPTFLSISCISFTIILLLLSLLQSYYTHVDN